jgi:hypothetical protein
VSKKDTGLTAVKCNPFAPGSQTGEQCIEVAGLNDNLTILYCGLILLLMFFCLLGLGYFSLYRSTAKEMQTIDILSKGKGLGKKKEKEKEAVMVQIDS